MSAHKSDKMMWTEIAKRMAAGEKQTVLARELGMKLGKFRYQLRKFLEQQERADHPLDHALNHPLDHAVNHPINHLDANQTNDPEETRQLYPVKTTLELNEDTLRELYDETWHRTWNVSRLALLVKEPTSLHAYWEVDEQKKRLVQKHFQSDWAHLPFYLQIYDVTDLYFDGTNANSTQRIQVRPEDDNWYIQEVHPRRNYIADFGTTTLQGNFFTILRSNVILTPPESTFEANGTPRFAPLGPRITPKFDSPVSPEVVSVGATTRELSTNFERPYPNEFDGYSVRIRG